MSQQNQTPDHDHALDDSGPACTDHGPDRLDERCDQIEDSGEYGVDTLEEKQELDEQILSRPGNTYDE